MDTQSFAPGLFAHCIAFGTFVNLYINLRRSRDCLRSWLISFGAEFLRGGRPCGTSFVRVEFGLFIQFAFCSFYAVLVKVAHATTNTTYSLQAYSIDGTTALTDSCAKRAPSIASESDRRYNFKKLYHQHFYKSLILHYYSFKFNRDINILSLIIYTHHNTTQRDKRYGHTVKHPLSAHTLSLLQTCNKYNDFLFTPFLHYNRQATDRPAPLAVASTAIYTV